MREAAAGTLALGRRDPGPPVLDRAVRPGWHMPPLQQLGPNRITGAIRAWMTVLRGYMLLTVGMEVFRIVRLALAALRVGTILPAPG